MLEIGSFFEKWRNRAVGEVFFRSAVTGAVRDALRFELEESAISYSNGIVFIKASPAAKGAILLKKTEILNKIKEKTKKPILDIK